MKISTNHSSFRLELRKSRIDGKGLFAMESIPARRKVVEYTGEKIGLREAGRRFRRMERKKGPKRMYLARLSKWWVIDGAVGGNGSAWINHSCGPNLFVKHERGKLNLYSKKRIHRGEELTADYRYAADAIQVKCRCGARKCRGTINLKR